MDKEKLKKSIKQALTENPDKKITPQELEDAMMAIVDEMGEGGADEERIEALEKGKQDKIEDLEEIREGAKLGATALQEYYDDGSHEVVPVKHPDLSTQPSILPYKFAGNYVYEQMFYVESGVDTICELPNDFLLLEMFGQIEGADGSVRIITEPFGSPDIYFSVALSGNKLTVSGAGNKDFKNAWFRVVWTTKPKAGGYYYQQGGNEATLELVAYSSTMATFPMTLEIDGREFDWIDNNGHITLYGDLMNKFLSGKAAITISRGSSYLRDITFHNNETNERGSMFVYPEDTFTVDNLAALAPQIYSNLERGISQRLYLNME